MSTSISTITVIYALLLYAATVILIAGLAYRINRYARTPSPLKIPPTPAPTSVPGVVLRSAVAPWIQRASLSPPRRAK